MYSSLRRVQPVISYRLRWHKSLRLNAINGDPKAEMSEDARAAEVLDEASPMMLAAGAASIAPAGATGSAPFSAIVRMKAGDGRPPLFLFPGSSGSLAQLAPLATHIELPIAIYGVKPKGCDPGETPFDRIEHMAQYAIDAIRPVGGKGPYLLAGFSVGGLVAFEIACRLSAAGASVPFLALLDSYPSEATWPLGCHVEVLAKQLIRHFAALKATPLRALGSYAKERLRGIRAYIWRSRLGPVTWQRRAPADRPQVEQRMHNASAIAHVEYLPSYYGGTIVFFRASELGMVPGNPRRFWGRFAREVEIHRMPGSHEGMVEIYPQALAARLGMCIKKVLPELERGSAIPVS